MNVRILTGSLAALLLASCAAYSGMGGGNTYFGFAITGVSGAPRPPRVSFAVSDESYDPVPDSDVYLVRDPGADCDVFRYGSNFFMYYGGYWYRSDRPDREFMAVDVRSVPRPVLQVPSERWRHHPMDGLERRRDDRRDNRDHDDHPGSNWH